MRKRVILLITFAASSEDLLRLPAQMRRAAPGIMAEFLAEGGREPSTIRLAGGLLGGTFVRYAADIAKT